MITSGSIALNANKEYGDKGIENNVLNFTP